jgi:hypothetical protein
MAQDLKFGYKFLRKTLSFLSKVKKNCQGN